MIMLTRSSQRIFSPMRYSGLNSYQRNYGKARFVTSKISSYTLNINYDMDRH